jgi:hypothetical protein
MKTRSMTFIGEIDAEGATEPLSGCSDLSQAKCSTRVSGATLSTNSSDFVYMHVAVRVPMTLSRLPSGHKTVF